MDLSNFFTTKGEAKDFSARLTNFSESIYKTDFRLEKSLLDIFGVQRKEAFLRLLRENSINSDKPAVIEKFITSLQSTIAKLPSMALTVAFEPQEQTLKAISNWFVINLKKQILLDFKVDESLIAGAQINFNGKFKDYSVKLPATNLIQSILSPKNTQIFVVKPQMPTATSKSDNNAIPQK